MPHAPGDRGDRKQSPDDVVPRDRGAASLRLIHAPRMDSADPATPRIGQPIQGAADPRWVLAVRTAEALEGPVLRPEKRDRLVRVGKVLGLTTFDANLVIAIVQDQARRGYAPEYCPTAGEPQLRLVPLRNPDRDEVADRKRRVLRIAFAISAVIAVELLLLKWWLT